MTATRLVAITILIGIRLFALDPFNPSKENSWAFPTTCPDPAAESPIDLRRLNEKVAGEHGWIRLSKDGNDFVRADGRRVQFWGTHMANGVKYGKKGKPSRDNWSMDDYRRHARWLARMGVNCVRLGNVAIHDPAPDAPPEKLDPVMVEGIFRRIAAAKEAGIYCQLSPVWFHGVKDIGRKLKIEGYDSGKANLTKLLFIHPEVQRVYRAWIKELYTTKNPHTGLSIAEDPAVFALEICNEDSLWWYGTAQVKGEAKELLESEFGSWAAKKYGSVAKAIEAWGQSLPGDKPDTGSLEFSIMWQLTQAGVAEKQIPLQRRHDQVAFLVDLQRDFHKEMKDYIRKELGCRQFISGSNFRSVDMVTTEDALRLGWQDLDIICNNSYFGNGGKQVTPGYRLDATDIMGFRSAVTHPLELPIRKRQVEGKPFLITETLWPTLHPHETEGPVVLAAYQAMNGIDGIYWAGPRDVTWNRSPYRKFWTINGSHAMLVFGNSQPGGMGQFPAAALLLRTAKLQAAPSVVYESRSRKQIIEGELPLTSEAVDFDNTVYGADELATGSDNSKAKGAPFLVGRVAVKLEGDPAEQKVMDIEKFIEPDKIRSVTNELCMDIGRRLFTVNAPHAKVASGYLREAGPITLGEVTVSCKNEHASISVISLDQKPLASSEQVFLQVGLPARPTGWRESRTTFTPKKSETEKEGLLIEATGELPWRIQNAELTVELANSQLSAATLLDGNGIPKRELPLERDGDRCRLVCPKDSMYIVLTVK